ncbi:MAG: AAA family ATPase [Verrucomicrobia bacterium]|nr:AAA family ATPase [Verrucomicrobiota bacterium]
MADFGNEISYCQQTLALLDMNGFGHVRLKTHKGLKTATLLNLGKINVICGPNNSGKTTVLECLTDKNLRVIGKHIGEGETKRINERSMAGKHWREQRFTDAYPTVLLKAAANRVIWFSTEKIEFWTALVAAWQSKFGATTPGEQTDVFRAYEEEFSDAINVVLIPAKRRLEASKLVNAHEDIMPDGRGILNFLFAAKNHDGTSEVRKRFDAITIAFQEVSAGYEFDVFVQAKDPNTTPSPTTIELRFRRKGSEWIQAVDCGLGLQELLIILYYTLASNYSVILVEEPENHLHPEIQRRLVTFLREKSEKQFFISTHSSVFLNTQFVDRVFTCRMTDSVQVENATSRAVVLTELGYSIADNLISDLVVLCEGPKDKVVLEEFFQKMDLVRRSSIKIWPLGGDIMDQLDLTVFQETHQLIALVDGDPGSSVIRKRFLKKCADLGIPVTRLKRYSLENYFTVEAIAAVMKGQMPSCITNLDPKKSVGRQLGFEVKNIGGRIAKEMRLEDIQGTDFDEFLQQVSKLLV